MTYTSCMKTPSATMRFIFVCYEILRLLFILTFRPEFDIDMLPASWYMAAPLLILPLILVFFIYQVPQPEEKKVYGRVFAYSKFLSVAGFFPFMRVALVPAFDHARATGYYSLIRMGILLIFLVIDVILALLVLLEKDEETTSPIQQKQDNQNHQEEGEDHDADNSNSQR